MAVLIHFVVTMPLFPKDIHRHTERKEGESSGNLKLARHSIDWLFTTGAQDCLGNKTYDRWTTYIARAERPPEYLEDKMFDDDIRDAERRCKEEAKRKRQEKKAENTE